MSTTHISYESTLDLLMTRGKQRKREAERMLARNRPEPDWEYMRALGISRRRWRVKIVFDFCDAVRESSAPLGKGAPVVAANHSHS